ncbi:MAG: hypothetical protein ACJ8ER_02310 [Allosphingosinicella sp.]
MSLNRAASTAMIAALLAGCASRTAPPATPPPAAAPRVEVDRVPPPPTPESDWRDLPLTPGGWTYAGTAGGSEAVYGGPAGTSLTLRCDSARRDLAFDAGAPDSALTVRTTFGDRTLAAGARLEANDPWLDELAFTRGRFTVARAGAPMLVIPAWPEPARVIEDCRA